LKNENKEAFLASIVHDMRAPLHIINGYSEHIEGLLEKDDPDNIRS
jgi:signal transduction histidine kinase